MKEDKFNTTIASGKKKVMLSNDGYGLELSTMRNGHQWTGAGVDDEIINMLIELLQSYKNTNQAKHKTRK